MTFGFVAKVTASNSEIVREICTNSFLRKTRIMASILKLTNILRVTPRASLKVGRSVFLKTPHKWKKMKTWNYVISKNLHEIVHSLVLLTISF